MNHTQTVIIRSTSGGFEPRFRSAQQFLQEIGSHVTPITWERTAGDALFASGDQINVLKSPAMYGQGWRNVFAHLRFFSFIIGRLRAIKPKLIYACDLDTLIPSLFWSVNKDVKIIFDQFDPISSRVEGKFLGYLLKHIEHFLSIRADIRITANKTRLPSKIRDRWFELKNIFPIQIGYQNDPKGTHPNVLFYGGVLTSDRGLLACAEAVSKDQNWVLQLYGQGEVAKSLKNSMYRNVFLHNPVPHVELMQIASRATLFLSLYEPFGFQNKYTASNKLFEAAQLGLPLLTNTGTQIGEIVSSLHLGWVVDYDDVEQIGHVLKEVNEYTKTGDRTVSNNLAAFYKAEEALYSQELDRLKIKVRSLLGDEY